MKKSTTIKSANVESLPTEEAMVPLTDTAPTVIEDPIPESEPELPSKVLYVDSPIKKALFDSCVRPQLMSGGRWGGKSQERLAAEWRDVTVVVDPELRGRTFEAQKTNWNVNDSNWVNPPTNYSFLSRTAREANGGVELHKKVLCGHLEDLKKTFALKA